MQNKENFDIKVFQAKAGWHPAVSIHCMPESATSDKANVRRKTPLAIYP
jgi:hypothetical protein